VELPSGGKDDIGTDNNKLTHEKILTCKKINRIFEKFSQHNYTPLA